MGQEARVQEAFVRTPALLIGNLSPFHFGVVGVPDYIEAGFSQITDRGKQFAVSNVAVVLDDALDSPRFAGDNLGFLPEGLKADFEDEPVQQFAQVRSDPGGMPVAVLIESAQFAAFRQQHALVIWGPP